MFEGMLEYLAGVCELSPASSGSGPTDEQVIDSGRDTEQDLSILSHRRLHKVELISLLIDVAGIVREKSQFTQYLNYCYAVHKETKPEFIEILPIKKPRI